MKYAILAYHVEAEVMAWTPTEDASLMERLMKAHEQVNRDGKLGPAARLGGTAKARTLRGPGNGMVIDGPFAETKEQLLGFYVVECASLEEAIDTATRIKGDEQEGAFEVRPLRLFEPAGPK